MTTFTYTDIYSSNEYDYIPEALTVKFSADLIQYIKQAKELLSNNKFLSAIDIDDNYFDWDTDADYAGKARNAYLKIKNINADNRVQAFIIFNNDYTSTTYEIVCSDDISKLLSEV